MHINDSLRNNEQSQKKKYLPHEDWPWLSWSDQLRRSRWWRWSAGTRLRPPPILPASYHLQARCSSKQTTQNHTHYQSPSRNSFCKSCEVYGRHEPRFYSDSEKGTWAGVEGYPLAAGKREALPWVRSHRRVHGEAWKRHCRLRFWWGILWCEFPIMAFSRGIVPLLFLTSTQIGNLHNILVIALLEILGCSHARGSSLPLFSSVFSHFCPSPVINGIYS